MSGSNKVVDTQELADELEALFLQDDDAKSIDEVEEAHGAMFRWFYPNRVTILSALRTTHSPSEAEVRERIARQLDYEADVTPCTEDAAVVRDTARLVRADFSYDAAEKIAEREDAADKTVELLREARSALRKLAGNAGALGAFEDEIRAAAGNTNWQCLRDAITQADATLVKLDSHLGEMK